VLLALLGVSEVFGFMAQWANTFYGSILTRRVVFSNGFALRVEFRHSHTNQNAALLPQLKTLEARFGNEFGPSSLAAH
jgi:hypothetical protein